MCAAAAIAAAPATACSQAFRRGCAGGKSTPQADAALELFRIARYRNIRGRHAAQGVRKLLDIAMAVAGSPRVVLLDEPTSGISIAEKFGLMEVVMAALQKPAPHRAVRRARHGDRRPASPTGVLAFYDGTVIADGAPAEALCRSAGSEPSSAAPGCAMLES